jgi:hypothetical protein
VEIGKLAVCCASAYKTLKNRLLVDFLLCKLRKQPDNRGFDGFFNGKSHQNLQVQQAASS